MLKISKTYRNIKINKKIVKLEKNVMVNTNSEHGKFFFPLIFCVLFFIHSDIIFSSGYHVPTWCFFIDKVLDSIDNTLLELVILSQKVKICLVRNYFSIQILEIYLKQVMKRKNTLCISKKCKSIRSKTTQFTYKW